MEIFWQTCKSYGEEDGVGSLTKVTKKEAEERSWILKIKGENRHYYCITIAY